MGSAVPRFAVSPRRARALAFVAALCVVVGCADPIERGDELAGREARPLPLPSHLERLARAAVLTGTAEAQPPPPRDASAAGASPASRLGLGAPPAPAPTVAGYAQSREAIVAELSNGEPSVLMPLGSGSVLRARFGAELAAVLRPKTRGQPEGPAAEVAAYRIAVALGLENVPPAVLRRLDEADLRRRFAGGAEQWDALRRTFAPDAGGGVVAAAIAYQPELRPLGLEQPREREAWERWLAHDGVVPEGSRALARDLGRMIVLDYLIANRERFDDPLRGLPDGSRVVLRNHDTAFPASLADGIERRLRGELRKTERFSRSMIAGLAALDRAALEALLAADGGPLLDAARIDGVLERRETILSYVEALHDRFGAAEVFFFE